MDKNPHSRIRSYVLRQGRVTASQREALRAFWPQFGLDFDANPIDLKNIFSRNAPCVLEIGFGNGESLLTQAEARPEWDFIGIEVHSPGVGRLLHEAKKRNLRNLRVFQHDAVDVLNYCIPDATLDAIQVFFPDPWPKKRHHKRRLIQQVFVKLAVPKLKLGGRFHCATDWEPYADQMVSVLSNVDGLINVSKGAVYYPDAYSLRPATKFEKRGLKLGYRVCDLLFRRKIDE